MDAEDKMDAEIEARIESIQQELRLKKWKLTKIPGLGPVHGPISKLEIIERIRSGSILRTHYVSSDDTPWTLAGEKFQRYFDCLTSSACKQRDEAYRKERKDSRRNHKRNLSALREMSPTGAGLTVRSKSFLKHVIKVQDIYDRMDPTNPTPQEHARSTQIAHDAIKKARETIEQELKLAEAVADARTAMEFSVAVWKKDVIEFMEKADTYLASFRQTRMAMDAETRHIKQGMADALSVLSAPDFPKQLERLKELADTLDRLKKLKETGFLDSISTSLHGPANTSS